VALENQEATRFHDLRVAKKAGVPENRICHGAIIRFVNSVFRQTMNAPDHLFFSESHEWVDATMPGAASVGIVVYLELPAIGRVVAKGEAFAVIESVKAANDIYAPVSGEIVEVNSALAESPEAINDAPYGAGWMVKIKLSNPAELDALMTGTAYREHLS
jgi:glycine cleavage system H protein